MPAYPGQSRRRPCLQALARCLGVEAPCRFVYIEKASSASSFSPVYEPFLCPYLFPSRLDIHYKPTFSYIIPSCPSSSLQSTGFRTPSPHTTQTSISPFHSVISLFLALFVSVTFAHSLVTHLLTNLHSTLSHKPSISRFPHIHLHTQHLLAGLLREDAASDARGFMAVRCVPPYALAATLFKGSCWCVGASARCV